MIQFTVHERVNPRDLNAPRKFYPFIKSTGEITLKQMSQRIASMSTVNRADVLAVLNVMVQVMTEEMADGNIIRLGEFGRFSFTLSGKGELHAADVTADHISRVNLTFRPGEDLAAMMQTLQYRKVAAPTPRAAKKKR